MLPFLNKYLKEIDKLIKSNKSSTPKLRNKNPEINKNCEIKFITHLNNMSESAVVALALAHYNATNMKSSLLVDLSKISYTLVNSLYPYSIIKTIEELEIKCISSPGRNLDFISYTDNPIISTSQSSPRAILKRILKLSKFYDTITIDLGYIEDSELEIANLSNKELCLLANVPTINQIKNLIDSETVNQLPVKLKTIFSLYLVNSPNVNYTPLASKLNINEVHKIDNVPDYIKVCTVGSQELTKIEFN